MHYLLIDVCNRPQAVAWGFIEKLLFFTEIYVNRETTMFADLLGRTASLITLIGAGLIAMTGLACLAFGSYGLFAGLHGGPMVACLLLVFGAGLTFVGYFCGRNGFKSRN